MQEEWIDDIPHVMAWKTTLEKGFADYSPQAAYARTLALTENESEAIEAKQNALAEMIKAGLPT